MYSVPMKNSTFTTIKNLMVSDILPIYHSSFPEILEPQLVGLHKFFIEILRFQKKKHSFIGRTNGWFFTRK